MARYKQRKAKRFKSILKCSKCDSPREALRKFGKKKKIGHKKNMFCPGCNRKREFVESGL